MFWFVMAFAFISGASLTVASLIDMVSIGRDYPAGPACRLRSDGRANRTTRPGRYRMPVGSRAGSQLSSDMATEHAKRSVMPAT